MSASSLHYLIISSQVADQPGVFAKLTSRITAAGCSVVESRLSRLGGAMCAMLLARGTWDAIAKAESAIGRLATKDEFAITVQRTEAQQFPNDHLPYLVEVFAADRPGIIDDLIGFLDSHNIVLETAVTSSPEDTVRAAMFSGHFTVAVPAKTHIPSLRESFLDFCDSNNLDAVIEPMK